MSVDVEQDISLYVKNGRQGLNEGLPRLLDLFHSLGIHANLFVQGNLVLSLADELKAAARHGHEVGLHGVRHRPGMFAATIDGRGLGKAASTLGAITGRRPTTHRAPNFLIREWHLPLLEQLGLLVDSSVLPNLRHVRLRGRVLVRSYEGAPTQPYHPSHRDLTKPGDSLVLEIPVTENPLFPAAPLGLGYLHTFGLRAALNAVSLVTHPYATFLIHSWEAVDLGTTAPHIPGYVRRECSENLEPLEAFLGRVADTSRIVLLDELASKRTVEEAN